MNKRNLALIGLIGLVLTVIIGYFFPEAIGVVLAVAPVAAIGSETVTVEGLRGEAGNMDLNIVEDDVARDITVVRPDNVPLDTALRKIGDVKTKSEVVKFGQSVMDNGQYLVSSLVGVNAQGTSITIELDAPSFEKTLISDVLHYEGPSNGEPVQMLVIGKDPTTRSIIAQIVAGGDGPDEDQLWTGGIPLGSILYGIGVAKHELDAQTEPYVNLPVFGENYCQIQMAQIEEGIYADWQLKKVDWGMLDYKADALYKFRLRCELTALVGKKARKRNLLTGKEILFSDGLENFVGWRAMYVPGATVGNGELSEGLFNIIGESVFTNVNGSDERFMFYDPAFMTELLRTTNITRYIEAGQTKTKYGFRVTEIETGFGILNLVPHRGLRFAGRKGQAVITDITKIRRRVFDPLHWREVELFKSGQSKATAWDLEERATIEVRVNDAHCWIYPVASKPGNPIEKLTA
jgi:hypothetical protein